MSKRESQKTLLSGGVGLAGMVVLGGCVLCISEAASEKEMGEPCRYPKCGYLTYSKPISPAPATRSVMRKMVKIFEEEMAKYLVEQQGV